MGGGLVAGLHSELLHAIAEGGADTFEGPVTPVIANNLLTKRGCPSEAPAEIRNKVVTAIPFVWSVREARTFPPFKKLKQLEKRKIDIAFLGNTYENRIDTKDPNKLYLQRHRPDMIAKLHESAMRHGWK